MRPGLVSPLLLLFVGSMPQASKPHAPFGKDLSAQSTTQSTTQSATLGNRMLQDLGSPFVPNVGQWTHPARFLYRHGAVTVLLEDRGWILGLQGAPDGGRRLGVALRMSFAGLGSPTRLVGEGQLPGHHNYFLGNEPSRWRTGVPLYASVRYAGLYPGVDLRLRDAHGHPEYDLLLEPGADLSRVVVAVAGATGLHLDADGALVVGTALGPLTQPVPQTWQSGSGGSKELLPCRYVLLGPDRFGFVVEGWDQARALTIDPGLLWSTFLGGTALDEARGMAMDANGVVTIAGQSNSPSLPTITGAYDASHNGSGDVFVSRLDPNQTGNAQLVYSTFVGGTGNDLAEALAMDANGVVTITGRTDSSDFPTTFAGFDTSHNGSGDVFVSRLDPSKTGSAQLVYSTFLGGSGIDIGHALVVDGNGVVTVAGATSSSNYPTTTGAFDTSHNGSFDGFVSRLDPSKGASSQLIYSTYLGGSGDDFAWALATSPSGVTVAGESASSNFPTTAGGYSPGFNSTGGFPPPDAFVTRLDPNKTASAQLVYSTYLGGTGGDIARAVAVNLFGVVTVTGDTYSTDFPTTPGAYDTTQNVYQDVFVSRLDPNKAGSAQLTWSTYVGSNYREYGRAIHVNQDGVVTVVGDTGSPNFPTTPGAYDTTFNGGGSFPSPNAFALRLDPSQTGSAQLVYSTFLGGLGTDIAYALAVDESGAATVAGSTNSTGLPITLNAYGTLFNGGSADAFVSRLDMGVAFYADRHQLSAKQAGAQQLTVNAGPQHAGRFYWIFGSVTGTRPGINLGVHIPLNPDFYTDFTIGAPTLNPPFGNFRGQLDGNGLANAAFNVPSGLPPLPAFTLYHAYLVYDAQGLWHMASNAVPLHLN